jgi:lipopolysaccharide assembly outer membrane protein LptD (OstA)
MKNKQLPWLSESKYEHISDPKYPEDFLTLESKLVVNTLKVGVLYVKPGQTKENEMLSNGSLSLSLSPLHISMIDMYMYLCGYLFEFESRVLIYKYVFV